jgi:Arc/MetJ-type ribon-helix-helix transcriptional regulator
MNTRGKTEKISVTLPQLLTAEIRATVAHGEVSAFFAEALEYYLAFRKQKSALEKGFGAWKNEDHPDLATPRDSTAYVNDMRKADKARLNRFGDDLAN